MHTTWPYMNVIDYAHIYERLNSSRNKKKLTNGSLENVGFPTASVETNNGTSGETNHGFRWTNGL